MQLIALYISGTINTILTEEHQKEMKRYFYNHQVTSQINSMIMTSWLYVYNYPKEIILNYDDFLG